MLGQRWNKAGTKLELSWNRVGTTTEYKQCCEEHKRPAETHVESPRLLKFEVMHQAGTAHCYVPAPIQMADELQRFLHVFSDNW